MPLESVTHISDLNVSNPPGTDTKAQGDDHIRNIKNALRTDFPNINGVVNATLAQLNALAGATVDGQILRRSGGAIAFGPMSILTDIRTTSAVLADATYQNVLSITLEAGRYIVEVLLKITSPAIDDANFKVNGGTATFTCFLQQIDSAIGVVTEAAVRAVNTSGSPSDLVSLFGELNCSVGGTFIIQVAKQADAGADGSVNPGSFVRAMRVL